MEKLWAGVTSGETNALADGAGLGQRGQTEPDVPCRKREGREGRG